MRPRVVFHRVASGNNCSAVPGVVGHHFAYLEEGCRHVVLLEHRQYLGSDGPARRRRSSAISLWPSRGGVFGACQV